MDATPQFDQVWCCFCDGVGKYDHQRGWTRVESSAWRPLQFVSASGHANNPIVTLCFRWCKRSLVLHDQDAKHGHSPVHQCSVNHQGPQDWVLPAVSCSVFMFDTNRRGSRAERVLCVHFPRLATLPVQASATCIQVSYIPILA